MNYNNINEQNTTMQKYNDIIYDIATQVENETGLPIQVESKRVEYDGILSLANVTFIIIVQTNIRESSLGLLVSRIIDTKSKSQKPIIVFSNYISNTTIDELIKHGVNFVDIAGNAYIKHKEIFIFIKGQKKFKIEKTNQTRIFQEAGIKLIFNFLHKPECIEYTYRELSKLVDISLGSVSNAMNELETYNYILKSETKRVLKNKKDLFNRWIIAYNEVLKPRLFKKKMRFVNAESYKNWQSITFKSDEGTILWGGEPAASLLTNYLKPEIFTIYTDVNWQKLVKFLGAIPDANGDIEIYQSFWKLNEYNRNLPIVPSILVYSDLLSSGIDRNIETAKIVYNDLLKTIVE